MKAKSAIKSSFWAPNHSHPYGAKSKVNRPGRSLVLQWFLAVIGNSL